VAATALWSALATFALVQALRAVTGLRVSDEQEYDGLDISAHGERGYDFT
jgi:Amt family ammonium transporter